MRAVALEQVTLFDWPPVRRESGMRMDASGLGRAEKRAALHLKQDGHCAVCGATGKLVADHDHKTGLLRGLLCRACNQREGARGSLLMRCDYPGIDAYLADPPAGRDWLWDLPDWWTQVDTAEMRKRGGTILEYVSVHGAERMREREQAVADLTYAIIRNREWSAEGEAG